MDSTDLTEDIRKDLVYEINEEPLDRSGLEFLYGKVWDTKELSESFEVLGFLAPFVEVREKSSGLRGSLEFQHNPRFYFNFIVDKR